MGYINTQREHNELGGDYFERQGWHPPKEEKMKTSNMTFGEALEALKRGEMVEREGWNGKGMFLVYQPGSKVRGSMMRNEAAKDYYGNSEVSICGHIDMKAADETYVVGWLASQTDMLAEDWRIVRI